jgi:hypothetical protein
MMRDWTITAAPGFPEPSRSQVAAMPANVAPVADFQFEILDDDDDDEIIDLD